MSTYDWDKISRAVEAIREGLAERIDGDRWKVYRVGKIIRINLSEK